MRTWIRNLLLISVIALFVGSVVAARSAIVVSIPICTIYNITLKGNAHGVAFERTGQIGIYKPGITSDNQQEVWITSGDPEMFPSSGAIRFTSNSFFAYHHALSGNKYNLALVKVASSPKAIHIDEIFDTTFYPYGKVNLYVHGADYKPQREIRKGEIHINFAEGGKIFGTIWVSDMDGNDGTYNATFVGSLYTNSTFSSCQFRNR